MSLKVLTEAPCTVRIARNTAVDSGHPPRLLVGVDGSEDADIAVTALAARPWSKGTTVNVVDLKPAAAPTK